MNLTSSKQNSYLAADLIWVARLRKLVVLGLVNGAGDLLADARAHAEDEATYGFLG